MLSNKCEVKHFAFEGKFKGMNWHTYGIWLSNWTRILSVHTLKEQLETRWRKFFIKAWNFESYILDLSQILAWTWIKPFKGFLCYW